jgi:hypothetical protein
VEQQHLERRNIMISRCSILLMISVLTSTCLGTTYYVDDDGTTYPGAYSFLQDALAIAVSGDEIFVAAGTYKPDENSATPGGTGSRSATFQLINGISIYGGNGGESILSGDIGTPGVSTDNCYHVVTGSGTSASAVLDGFTVTGGYANGSGETRRGGGMFNKPGSPTVSNCTFTENYASFGGSGMYNEGYSSPVVINCIFSEQIQTLYGAGMHNHYYSSPVVINCLFTGNFANYGSAIYNENRCSPTITNCTFCGNYNYTSSGTIHCTYLCYASLKNCIIWNVSTRAIYSYNGSPTVEFSDIQNGYFGTGNINSDPKFISASYWSGTTYFIGDHHLQDDSPCIDWGYDAAVTVSTDLEGNPRISGAHVDMGAYEIQAGPINTSPVAVCKDVVVPAGVDGTADVSIDDGSYDPDGDPITVEQAPPGPYAVGVHEVTLTVTDSYGESDSCQAMVVVYDASAGFVTGGGWIWSPAGALMDNQGLEGKANFGFVSKYKKGANVPTGNTAFVFEVAELEFHSTSYDWLVVTGSDYARFKGTGTINDAGEYKFMLWAGDNNPDTFRIKIWEEDELGVETDVYDNGFDQVIGGGSIKIHTN